MAHNYYQQPSPGQYQQLQYYQPPNIYQQLGQPQPPTAQRLPTQIYPQPPPPQPYPYPQATPKPPTQPIQHQVQQQQQQLVPYPTPRAGQRSPHHAFPSNLPQRPQSLYSEGPQPSLQSQSMALVPFSQQQRPVSSFVTRPDLSSQQVPAGQSPLPPPVSTSLPQQSGQQQPGRRPLPQPTKAGGPGLQRSGTVSAKSPKTPATSVNSGHSQSSPNVVHSRPLPTPSVSPPKPGLQQRPVSAFILQQQQRLGITSSSGSDPSILPPSSRRTPSPVKIDTARPNIFSATASSTQLPPTIATKDIVKTGRTSPPRFSTSLSKDSTMSNATSSLPSANSSTSSLLLNSRSKDPPKLQPNGISYSAMQANANTESAPSSSRSSSPKRFVPMWKRTLPDILPPVIPPSELPALQKKGILPVLPEMRPQKRNLSPPKKPPLQTSSSFAPQANAAAPTTPIGPPKGWIPSASLGKDYKDITSRDHVAPALPDRRGSSPEPQWPSGPGNMYRGGRNEPEYEYEDEEDHEDEDDEDEDDDDEEGYDRYYPAHERPQGYARRDGGGLRGRSSRPVYQNDYRYERSARPPNKHRRQVEVPPNPEFSSSEEEDDYDDRDYYAPASPQYGILDLPRGNHSQRNNSSTEYAAWQEPRRGHSQPQSMTMRLASSFRQQQELPSTGRRSGVEGRVFAEDRSSRRHAPSREHAEPSRQSKPRKAKRQLVDLNLDDTPPRTSWSYSNGYGSYSPERAMVKREDLQPLKIIASSGASRSEIQLQRAMPNQVVHQRSGSDISSESQSRARPQPSLHRTRSLRERERPTSTYDPPVVTPAINIESPAPVGGRDRLADIPRIELEGNATMERRRSVPSIVLDDGPSTIDINGRPPQIPRINVDASTINVGGVDEEDAGPRRGHGGPRVQVYEIPGISVAGPGDPSGPHVHGQSMDRRSDSGGTEGRRGGLTCGGCGNGPIAGRIVNAMGLRWHPSCFRCCVCDALLEHVSSYEKDGRPYCHLDYHENFAPRCYSCKTAIIEERFISIDDPALGKRTYHEQHFFCAECGDPFLAPSSASMERGRTGGEFAVTGDGVYESDDVGFTVYRGHPYCEACHVRLRLPKCKKCKRSIRDGDRAVEALGGKWCWGCFVCVSCERPFADPSFFERDGKPFCESCFSIMLRNEV